MIQENLHKNSNPFILQRAKELRKNETSAEKKLWEILRGRRLFGNKFRRQHPLGKFIADFYCHERSLAVELDGGVHETEEQKERDKARTYMLEEYGVTVLRFQNEEVFYDLNSVIQTIEKHLNNKKTSLS